jgi:hypothetical protein
MQDDVAAHRRIIGRSSGQSHDDHQYPIQVYGWPEWSLTPGLANVV